MGSSDLNPVLCYFQEIQTFISISSSSICKSLVDGLASKSIFAYRESFVCTLNTNQSLLSLKSICNTSLKQMKHESQWGWGSSFPPPVQTSSAQPNARKAASAAAASIRYQVQAPPSLLPPKCSFELAFSHSPWVQPILPKQGHTRPSVLLMSLAVSRSSTITSWLGQESRLLKKPWSISRRLASKLATPDASTCQLPTSNICSVEWAVLGAAFDERGPPLSTVLLVQSVTQVLCPLNPG